jgi:hypothetical protein
MGMPPWAHETPGMRKKINLRAANDFDIERICRNDYDN